MRRQRRHTNDPSREQAAVIDHPSKAGIVQRLAGELLSPGRAAGAPDAGCQLRSDSQTAVPTYVKLAISPKIVPTATMG